MFALPPESGHVQCDEGCPLKADMPTCTGFLLI
jgi:hypothetical protein